MNPRPPGSQHSALPTEPHRPLISSSISCRYLTKAFDENDDDRVKGMVAWAMGRIGNKETIETLELYKKQSSKAVLEEINFAIETLQGTSDN